MSSVNVVFVSGNLTRDPELRYVATGTPLLIFSIAVSRNYQRDGQWQKEVSYVDAKCWGQTAERAAERMAKGAEVAIAGRLQMESWQTSDGANRSKLLVVADRVDVVRGGKTAGNSRSFVPVADDDLPF
jgi:single-strand DNA-binding protein